MNKELIYLKNSNQNLIYNIIIYRKQIMAYKNFPSHLPAWCGVIMWWDDNNTYCYRGPQQVNHLLMGQCCYSNFADFYQSAPLTQSCLPGITIWLHLIVTKFGWITAVLVRCFILPTVICKIESLKQISHMNSRQYHKNQLQTLSRVAFSCM